MVKGFDYFPAAFDLAPSFDPNLAVVAHLFSLLDNRPAGVVVHFYKLLMARHFLTAGELLHLKDQHESFDALLAIHMLTIGLDRHIYSSAIIAWKF